MFSATVHLRFYGMSREFRMRKFGPLSKEATTAPSAAAGDGDCVSSSSLATGVGYAASASSSTTAATATVAPSRKLAGAVRLLVKQKSGVSCPDSSPDAAA